MGRYANKGGKKLIWTCPFLWCPDLAQLKLKMHLLAIGFIALAVALIMAPAAFHRQTGGQKVTQQFIQVSTRFVLWSMPPLALSLCLEFLAWAIQMGHSQAAELFRQSLEEEKAADEKLTQLAESIANAKAETSRNPM